MSNSKVGLKIPAKLPSQSKQFRQLESKLMCAVSSRDLFLLKKQLHKIQHTSDLKQQLLLWEKCTSAIARSQDWVEKRRAGMPDISFPDLPVAERADEIRDLIRDNQVVVIAGETGSGKTTQLPKICLEAGCGSRGMIGHTS